MLYSMEEVGIRLYRTLSFSCIKSYQESLKIVLFKMLYGHRCPTPLFWNKTREWKVLNPTYCKKPTGEFTWWERTYRSLNQGRRYMPTLGEENWDFGDCVYLKVSPMRGLPCFKVWGKLAPRFIGPFKITNEREEELKAEFSNFFSNLSESWGRDSF
jgi:hypothetical protein